MNIIVLFGNENCNFFGYKRFFKIYLGSKAMRHWLIGIFATSPRVNYMHFTWLIV